MKSWSSNNFRTNNWTRLGSLLTIFSWIRMKCRTILICKVLIIAWFLLLRFREKMLFSDAWNSSDSPTWYSFSWSTWHAPKKWEVEKHRSHHLDIKIQTICSYSRNWLRLVFMVLKIGKRSVYLLTILKEFPFLNFRCSKQHTCFS